MLLRLRKTVSFSDFVVNLQRYLSFCLTPGSALAVQSFTFVKTEEDSSFLFGFCRQSSTMTSFPVTSCLLSFLPWHNAFKKLLDILAEIGHQVRREVEGETYARSCNAYKLRPHLVLQSLRIDQNEFTIPFLLSSFLPFFLSSFLPFFLSSFLLLSFLLFSFLPSFLSFPLPPFH